MMWASELRRLKLGWCRLRERYSPRPRFNDRCSRYGWTHLVVPRRPTTSLNRDSIMRTFRKAFCVSALVVSACTSVPCPPPKVVTQIVKEPVAVACIDPALIPPEPGAVQLPIDARLAADLAASQAKDLRVWGRKLLALATPCTTDRTAQ